VTAAAIRRNASDAQRAIRGRRRLIASVSLVSPTRHNGDDLDCMSPGDRRAREARRVHPQTGGGRRSRSKQTSRKRKIPRRGFTVKARGSAVAPPNPWWRDARRPNSARVPLGEILATDRACSSGGTLPAFDQTMGCNLGFADWSANPKALAVKPLRGPFGVFFACNVLDRLDSATHRQMTDALGRSRATILRFHADKMAAWDDGRF
jgi:hypothetical protein